MPFNLNQDPYTQLRDIVAEQTRPVLAWVGSGVSAGAGLPTWPALRETLVDGLHNKAESFGDNRSERQRLHSGAELATAEESPWVAFEMLRSLLGKTSYRELVRGSFADVHRVATPDLYRDLWKLRIKGMLTLNLDRLAARSMGEVHGDQTPIELSGTAIDRLRTSLSGRRPIVANLHGIFEDTDTWIFTHKQLAALGKKSGYRSLIETCLSMFTIVFVGISVDDIAVGGHLDRMRALDIELPTHFWISDRRDFAIDQWAEDAGVRMIRYAAKGGDHSQLAELFGDLATYLSHDANGSPPVSRVSTAMAAHDLPDEAEMLSWAAEDIRTALNAHATKLLTPRSVTAYEEYERFAREYDQAIYRAWYATTQSDKNKLLGYELEEHVARGAFGNVFKAQSPRGTIVAIKILLDEVRQDAQALQSFRRGVQSMRILEERQVSGMAAYLEASEIPACVVMEWIEGPNLAEAKQAKRIDDWYSLLPIAQKLTRIIRTAHMLPERVLHRDIRPSNIMLRNYWLDPEACDVVVLDFDLSWHQGALERSVLHAASAGYLAPEQLRTTKYASTRSALVDSFGLGMTLFYLCGGREPIPEQHRHSSWIDDVQHACGRLEGSSWRSLPTRFARLIIACTRDKQSDRWGMAEIERELGLLGSTLGADVEIDPELIAEEIAARSDSLLGYVWDDDAAEASRDSGTGLRLAVRADMVNEEIEAHVHYVSQGSGERGKLNRYLNESVRTLRDQFASAGWKVTQNQSGFGYLDVSARVPADAVAPNVDTAVQLLDRLFGALKMDRV